MCAAWGEIQPPYVIWVMMVFWVQVHHGRMNYIKTPNPLCRLFFTIDQLTEIAALCLTDFIDWRYIHSLVGIFDPACELLPLWTKELYLCAVAPLSSLWPPPPLSQTKCTVYTNIVCLRGGGEGVNWAVDHILQEFYPLFLTRFRTYQIYTPPQTKWPVKTTLKVHKIENFFGSEFEFYTISLLVMLKY